MSEKKEKHYINELKEMIQEKKPSEPVDKVFAVFCHRHGISMDECKKYYDKLQESDKNMKE